MIQEMNKMESSIFKKFQNLNKRIPLTKAVFSTTHDPSKFWVRVRLKGGPV